LQQKSSENGRHLGIESTLCTRFAPSLQRLNPIKKMNIEFDNAALEELYTSGATQDHQYKRLPKDIIKRYVKVVNYLKAARRLEDLFLIKSLHYEKKKGDLNGVDAVWINDQYRLFFYSSPDDSGIIVNALLFEISKHYE
jgi:proteic killer suppression protein